MRIHSGTSLAVVGLGMAILAPLVAAQRRGPATFPARNRGFSVSFHARPQRALRSSALWLGAPYWYADYTPQPVASEAPAPQVVVVQAPPAEAQPEARLPEPLMIELEGERYVRFQGPGAAEERAKAADEYAKASSPASSAKRSASPEPKSDELPPVVILYRDGHREEIHEYTITDGTIYARGDYWTDGYWEKKIQLSSLNVPATIKANQKRGVKFVLPSSPDQVVTRP